ncbi:MAG TPA: sigma 54-interacting transcriptional regulator [bacterium]|nr:sigma 54-interacting transcriptional regulator [bacterium]
MLHSTEFRMQAIREQLEQIAPGNEKLLRRLNLVQLDLLLTHLFEIDYDPSRYLKRFCVLLAEQIELAQASLLISRQPYAKRQLHYFQSKGSKPGLAVDAILHQCNHRRKSPLMLKLQPGDDRACGLEGPVQYLLIVPVASGERIDSRLGHLLFWFNCGKRFTDYDRIIKRFARLLAESIIRQRLNKVREQLAAANRFESNQIKKVIQKSLTALQAAMGCDYSVALVLKRAITDLNNDPARAGVQNYEVVTEYLKGKARLAKRRSKATGLWIEESEGLLALALAQWREDSKKAKKGLTFHQVKPGSNEYLCLETGERGFSLRGCEDEVHEQSLHYMPLVHEGNLIGYIKASYRSKTRLTELDQIILSDFADFLAERIHNSFIYSLTVEQTRFLQTIKSMFEGADRMEARNFADLGQFLLDLTQMIAETTQIDTVAIGYLTKDVDGEKVLRFPHPRGWDEKASLQFRELPVTEGLAGLAVRTKRNVFLAPVEEPQNSSDPEPTVYVDETRSRFVDVRKHPSYLNHAGYRKLSSYYIKVREEKVYANYIFVIEFKNIVLGVIDVEVAQNNWDRFMGIGYLHFFRTLASMLALLFFRVRLAEEHTRMVQAVKWLSDAVYMSPTSVVRTILAMLQSIYGVEKAKIIPGDLFKEPIEIDILEGGVEKYAHLFLGYTAEEMERFAVPGDRIDAENLFLLEFKNHLLHTNDFFMYIPDIEEYQPHYYDRRVVEKFERFRSRPRFYSYLAILLGDKSRSLGVLELVSQKVNAFDELLIDQSFVETWTSQISMALRYALLEEKREGSMEASPRAERAPVILRTGKVVPWLAADALERGCDLVGTGPAMAKLRALIEAAALTSSVPILIQGESGTGKDLVAKAIHRRSGWAQDRFITQDCGAFSRELIEDALFGHVRGAFTSATEERKGLFECAHGGTLFLDEISNMSLELQSKFLRVLEDARITPLGSSKSIHVQVQILAATNADLEEKIRLKEFRQDLYYRLAAITIATIPLRRMIEEEPANLLMLISHFAASGLIPASFTGISRNSLEALLAFDFPGNVRQLRNLISNAAFSARDQSILEIPQEALASDPKIQADKDRPHTLKEVEDFIHKYQRIGRFEHTPEAVVSKIQSALRSSADDLEKISSFIDAFGTIDVPLAGLLAGVGPTWARRLLKERLRLKLHPRISLYFRELP